MIMNIKRKEVYILFSFWILWKIKISLSSVPDPCPDIQPNTQVTDMCKAGFAVEQTGESKDGHRNFDHVTLRARKQEDNCTCLVFIENQSWISFQMYREPYQMLQSSAPKEVECGMELNLGFYDKETLQENKITDPIKCTSGQAGSSFSLNRNSVLRFTSNVINGNFTRGYCVDIRRVHVNGQNGTLKIVCGVPGVIPSTQYTTPPSVDQFTKSSSIDQSTPPGSPVNHSDDSTVYIASGASAGVVVIVATAISIIFCKRHRSKSKQPVPIDNVNMQYDSLSESRNDSNYSTLNSGQADDQQYELVVTQT